MALNIESYLKTHNRREKYSHINLSYWEAEDHSSVQEYLFWLDDATTFSVKGEKVVIPVSSYTEKSGGGEYEVRVDFKLPLELIWTSAQRFPVRGKDKLADMGYNLHAWSVYHIWGEDDNISILPSEFSDAGGTVSFEYNTVENQYEVIVTPPDQKIGVNENFSLTLEGSVPALAIGGLGYLYRKKTITGYTEHIGKVSAALDIELHHVTNKHDAFLSLQRLISKYNTLQPTYSVEYLGPKSDPYLEEPPIFIDNNQITPQNVGVSYVGEHALKNTSSGFAYTPFNFFTYGNLRSKKFKDLKLEHITFNELNYNLHAYLN